MATIKSFTSLEQSKKLSEFLPLESADHHYVRKVTDFMGNPVDGEWSHPKYGNPNSKYANYIVQNFTTYETIPCWSLAALFSVLPLECGMHKQTDDSLTYYYVEYPCKIKKKYLFSKRHDNPIDACYEMIIKLNEQKLL